VTTLAEEWDVDRLANLVVPLEGWHPYPRRAERDRWHALPAATRSALVARGEEALELDWPELRASGWLEFVRIGDRGRFESTVFTRRMIHRDLVVAESVEGEGRFVERAADALWATCEESSWSWPACLYMQTADSGLPDVVEPVVDLGAGETAAQAAWATYLIGSAMDEVSPLINARVLLEAQRRVIDPYLARDDFWWQKAVNNWNPWCHANVLTTTLCLEPSPERRARVVAKALRFLDAFLVAYPDDGGCDEGATYWGRMAACLYECGDLLRMATGGAVNLFATPVMAEIARFVVRTHIAGPWYMNFADGGPRPPMVGHMVRSFGQAVGDPDVERFGTHLAQASIARDPGQIDAFGRMLPALFGMDEVVGAPAGMPALQDVWLPVIEVMAARERPDHKGTYLAAKGGHNAEVHNHNDVGSFLVYLDGEPVVVDAGVDSYTRDTFSDRRYTIWTMQSGWHNVPLVNGVEQEDGRAFASRRTVHAATEEHASLEVDLTDAYPAAAGIRAWTRALRLDRTTGAVHVKDTWSLEADTGHLDFTILVLGKPSIEGPGRVRVGPLAAGRAALITSEPLLAVTSEPAPMGHGALAASWPVGLTRLRFVAPGVASEGTVTISVTPEEKRT